MKLCAQCRSGENEVEASVYVEGKIWNNCGDKMMPYHAYLCDDHLTMLDDDGAEFKVVRSV